MALNLPRYCIIFDRAVKLVATEDGGMKALVYDESRDDFVDPVPELARYLFFPNDEAEQVTEAEFDAYLRQLRERETARRAAGAGAPDER